MTSERTKECPWCGTAFVDRTRRGDQRFCSIDCRTAFNYEKRKVPCKAGCGAEVQNNNWNSGYCRQCSYGGAALRRRTIELMWEDGYKLREIAETLGTTVNAVGSDLHRMREEGYDLPYRRTPEQLVRIRDAARGAAR